MSGALEGIKVVDLSRVLAGPYCTMTLGDLGAEIIKVEAPGGSDDTRYWGPPFKGSESAYYLCTNRNKRAITLNLKSEQGIAVLKKLLADADVVIENFKNGTMAKWGLSYEEMKELNPRIIHCSITGFGRNGPYSHLPGYDFIIQAMAGLMSITGSEESGPMKVGVAISDIITGLNATIGILAALQERNVSGEGQSVDISLYDSQISALANVASNYLISKSVPGLLGNQHPNIVPYQPFPTKDGQMVVAVGNDGQFRKLCKVLKVEHLASDERFATNTSRLSYREELVEMLGVEMKKRSAREWLLDLNEAGIPAGPIQNMEELFADPQVEARQMVYTVDHPAVGEVQLVGSPLKLSKTPVQVRRHPPLAGEHTQEVLTELGYSEEDVHALFENNII
ncbi:CaiB/BaiF CoA-transferase family protein [Bacillus tianshenii]|nr:CaiB/BaiF CoA-transferase family protein [Bacillus tianshenii]